MKIFEMSVSGYRNLKTDVLKFSPNVNLIYGKNAQGKTNLIEAVWMFTGARSFRGTKDADLINFNETSAKIEGKFFFENRSQEIAVFFANGKRKAFLNGVAKAYPTHIIGKFRAVLFSPVHLFLISGGPDGRRKFLDSAICQLKPAFTSLTARYNQTLRQRNALLKKNFQAKNQTEFLDVWNEKLAELGALVVKERFLYLSELQKEAVKIYSEISGGKEALKINYISSFLKDFSGSETVSEIKSKLLPKLEKNIFSDLKSGFTSCGPHKDELEIFVDEKRVKSFGSQGQQRSAALSLKLAEAAVLEKAIGEPPVILLDDVMSELDAHRKNYLMQKTLNRQVFITTCDKEYFENIKNGKIFKMDNGKISEEKVFEEDF